MTRPRLAPVAVFARMQVLLLLRSPNLLATLAVIPLYSLVFFAVLARHHQGDLATSVALTAFLMSLWSHAVFVAAEIVDDDRWQGTLELSLLTPARYLAALTVRVGTTTALALPVLAEVLLIGRGLFGFPIHLADPGLCLLVVLLVVAGVAATAMLASGVMILVRGARALQNALTYPFYLLAGLIVPVSTLPGPARALARLFFLSWGAQLLRDTAAGPVSHLVPRLTALVALVVLQGVLGVTVLRKVLSAVRHGGVVLHG
ncbi:ABC transporter permease [Kitasatospora sp. LaBMicrA B282]|uniref:ABC transporter permease n=1 Tax=Kitasatospora sp. LaBMicrA B282 TaxID=3420949 RepID=UPI003D0EB850